MKNIRIHRVTRLHSVVHLQTGCSVLIVMKTCKLWFHMDACDVNSMHVMLCWTNALRISDAAWPGKGVLNGSIMDVRRLKTLAKTSDSAVCLLYCKYFLYLWERSATQNHSQLLSAPFSLFKISIYWLIGMFVGWLKFCFYFGSCMILIYHHLLSLFVPPYLFLLFLSVCCDKSVPAFLDLCCQWPVFSCTVIQSFRIDYYYLLYRDFCCWLAGKSTENNFCVKRVQHV